jgi:hypothetical protein
MRMKDPFRVLSKGMNNKQGSAGNAQIVTRLTYPLIVSESNTLLSSPNDKQWQQKSATVQNASTIAK